MWERPGGRSSNWDVRGCRGPVMARPCCWSNLRRTRVGLLSMGQKTALFKGSFPQQMPGPPGRHVHSPSGPSGKPTGTHQLWGDPVTCVRRARQSYKGPPDFLERCRCPCVGSLRDLGARPPPGETGRSMLGSSGLFGGHIWLGALGPTSLLLALSPGLSPEKTLPGVCTWRACTDALKARKQLTNRRRERPVHPHERARGVTQVMAGVGTQTPE